MNIAENKFNFIDGEVIDSLTINFAMHLIESEEGNTIKNYLENNWDTIGTTFTGQSRKNTYFDYDVFDPDSSESAYAQGAIKRLPITYQEFAENADERDFAVLFHGKETIQAAGRIANNLKNYNQNHDDIFGLIDDDNILDRSFSMTSYQHQPININNNDGLNADDNLIILTNVNESMEWFIDSMKNLLTDELQENQSSLLFTLDFS